MKSRHSARDDAGNGSSADLRQTAIDVYRDGFPRGDWEPPPPFVAGCVSVATILHSACEAPSEIERANAVERSRALARSLLTPESILRGPRHDPVGVHDATTELRILADQLARQHPHHRRLSDHILSSLACIVPRESIEGGRVLIALGRSAITSGREDLALELAAGMISLGRRLKRDELLIHGWGRVGAYFQVRGNLPRAERAGARMLKYARRLNDPRLLALALDVAGAVKGMRGDYAGSTVILWQALNMADQPEVRSIILGNLAETLYRAGHFAASRSARALLLRLHLEINALFITLGGYAVTCAALGDVAGARWAADQTLALSLIHRRSRGVADGLLGCADACARIGLDVLARTLYERGVAVADAHGYHDLRFRADPVARVATRAAVQSFTGPAEDAMRSILDLAPDGVSSDFTLVSR